MVKQQSENFNLTNFSIQNYLITNLGLDLSDRISIPSVLKRRFLYSPSRPALKQKINGNWEVTTYQLLQELILQYSAEFIGRGYKRDDRAAIFLPNCKAWAISDLGNLFAGAVTVPIYETLSNEIIQHILKDSQSKIIVLKTVEQARVILGMKANLPHLQDIIILDPPDETMASHVIHWEQWLEGGAKRLADDRTHIESIHRETHRDDLATIIYTSGTTGLPKGVMLSHKNILSNLYGISLIADYNETDELLSLLPLSHIFERTIGHFCPIMMGSCISYAESIEKVAENLQEIRPTICAAVPRIFEKIYGGISAQVEAGSPIKKALFAWVNQANEASDRSTSP